MGKLTNREALMEKIKAQNTPTARLEAIIKDLGWGVFHYRPSIVRSFAVIVELKKTGEVPVTAGGITYLQALSRAYEKILHKEPTDVKVQGVSRLPVSSR